MKHVMITTPIVEMAVIASVKMKYAVTDMFKAGKSVMTGIQMMMMDVLQLVP